jgi:hypothetical protein
MADPRAPKPGERRGGRAKGVPNKRATDILDKLKRYNFDPARKLIELTMEAERAYHANKHNEEGARYLAIASKNCADLMKFVYPIRKAVDITSNGEKIPDSFAEMVKSVLEKPETEALDVNATELIARQLKEKSDTIDAMATTIPEVLPAPAVEENPPLEGGSV